MQRRQGAGHGPSAACGVTGCKRANGKGRRRVRATVSAVGVCLQLFQLSECAAVWVFSHKEALSKAVCPCAWRVLRRIMWQVGRQACCDVLMGARGVSLSCDVLEITDNGGLGRGVKMFRRRGGPEGFCFRGLGVEVGVGGERGLQQPRPGVRWRHPEGGRLRSWLFFRPLASARLSGFRTGGRKGRSVAAQPATTHSLGMFCRSFRFFL